MFWFNVCSRTHVQINKPSRFISIDVLAWKEKREYKQLMLFVLQSIFPVTEGKETFLKFPINLPDLFTSFASLNWFFVVKFPLDISLKKKEKEKAFPQKSLLPNASAQTWVLIVPTEIPSISYFAHKAAIQGSILSGAEVMSWVNHVVHSGWEGSRGQGSWWTPPEPVTQFSLLTQLNFWRYKS